MFKSFNCLISKLIVVDIYISSSLYFFPSEGTGNTDNITLTQLQSIDYTLIFLIGAMVNILIILFDSYNFVSENVIILIWEYNISEAISV